MTTSPDQAAATADDAFVRELRSVGCKITDEAATEITSLRAERDDARRGEKYYLARYEELHSEWLATAAARAAAVQRADLFEQQYRQACQDHAQAMSAIAAERAARERMREALQLARKWADPNAEKTIGVGYAIRPLNLSDVLTQLDEALSAPAEASAGEADRTFTDEMVEAGARELVRIEHAKHSWTYYMICSRAVLGAALNIPARPAQKDSE